MNVFGPVVNSQLAGPDITKPQDVRGDAREAESQMDRLEGIDDGGKDETKSLLVRMRGVAVTGAGAIATGAGAEMAASVMANVIGVPLSPVRDAANAVKIRFGSVRSRLCTTVSTSSSSRAGRTTVPSRRR